MNGTFTFEVCHHLKIESRECCLFGLYHYHRPTHETSFLDLTGVIIVIFIIIGGDGIYLNVSED